MFTITITETKTVKKVIRGKHGVIEERPYKEDELDGMSHVYSSAKDIGLKAIYGYAPDREEEVEETRELLKQQVEELSLSAVIRAINGL